MSNSKTNQKAFNILPIVAPLYFFLNSKLLSFEGIPSKLGKDAVDDVRRARVETKVSNYRCT